MMRGRLPLAETGQGLGAPSAFPTTRTPHGLRLHWMFGWSGTLRAKELLVGRAAAGLVLGSMANGILWGFRGSGWFFRRWLVGSAGRPRAPLVM
jgi:hypothetical protein